MEEQVTLTYFNGRGLGEGVRILLCAAGIKERILKTREEYLKLCEDGMLLFGQVPLLEIDNLCIVQQRAIQLYVARKADMLGQNDADYAKILMYYEGVKDAIVAFLPIGFRGSEAEVLADAEEKTLPKYLPIFEKALIDSGTGFLVGERTTLADLTLLELLLVVDEFFPTKLLDYSQLKTFLECQKKVEVIARYLRDVRKGKNDNVYVDSVKAILSHRLK